MLRNVKRFLTVHFNNMNACVAQCQMRENKFWYTSNSKYILIFFQVVYLPHDSIYEILRIYLLLIESSNIYFKTLKYIVGNDLHFQYQRTYNIRVEIQMISN